MLNAMQIEALAASKLHDEMIITSPTGSGKTLAFLLPVFTLLETETKGVQALVLVPTRELALQIEQVFRSMKTGFKVNCCYGGHDVGIEENNLKQPPQILIGTPGRIRDHIGRQNIDTSSIKILVLDEFDKCLEMGFEDQMQAIIDSLANVKSKILTSATQFIAIPSFVKLANPFKIDFIKKQESGLIIKILMPESGESKLDALYKLICHIGSESVIVFCNQRDEVESVCEFLSAHKIINNNFHGGLEQNYRESTLIKFRNGSNQILVTTDLAARGLDIPNVKYVVHFHLPAKEDAYIHRNGRTARMDARGVAVLMLNYNDRKPAYFPTKNEQIQLMNTNRLPEKPVWETLFFGAGKKEKINKMDIVGFLTKIGSVAKEDIGLIEVKDQNAYAAIKRGKIKSVLEKIKNEKIKGRKIKIEIARDSPKVVVD